MAELGSFIISFIVGIMASLVAALVWKWFAEIKPTRLSFNTVLEYILSLYRTIQADGYVPDFIVAIDRQGCIVGSILAGHLGSKAVIAAATENTKTSDGRRQSIVSPVYRPRDGILSGKKILIVSCFNDTGTTLEMVYEYYSSLPDGPAEIRTAALFTSVSPKLKPKYYVKEIGKDIMVPMNRIMQRMPWITKDWKHGFFAERFTKDA